MAMGMTLSRASKYRGDDVEALVSSDTGMIVHLKLLNWYFSTQRVQLVAMMEHCLHGEMHAAHILEEGDWTSPDEHWVVQAYLAELVKYG